MALRIHLLPLLASLLLLGPAVLRSDEPAGDKQPANDKNPAARSAREAEIRLALDRPISLSFTEAPLDDVVKKLREQTKIDVMLDQKNLDGVGIGGDTPITFRLDGVCLRSALRLLLRDLELTWVILDEALLITTPEVAEENLTTRFHPIVDLVRNDRPARFLQMQFGGGGLGGGGLGGGGLGGGEADGLKANAIRHLADLDERRDRDGRVHFDTLVELISTTVAPDTWDHVGGPGSMSRFRNLLAVSQTEEVHEQVEALLKNLRKFKKQIANDEVEQPLLVDMPYCDGSARKLVVALDDKTSIEFKETPLAEAMQSIAKKQKIPILLDHRSLDDLGISADTPVSAEARDVPLKVALQRLLRPLELAWTIYENALLITSPEMAEEGLSTRVYYVRDLIRPTGDDSLPTRDALEELSETIHVTVAPDSWDEVGGPGSLAPLADLDALVVSQTSEIHDQIVSMIDDLRRKTAPAKVAAAPGDAPAAKLHLVVYRLLSGPDGKPLVSPEQLVEVVGDLIEPKSWHDRDVYLRGVGSTLVVRQTATVHRKIVKLLEALDAIEPQTTPPGGLGGGGFF